MCLHKGRINVAWVILNLAFAKLLNFAIQIFFFFYREQNKSLLGVGRGEGRRHPARCWCMQLDTSVCTAKY